MICSKEFYANGCSPFEPIEKTCTEIHTVTGEIGLNCRAACSTDLCNEEIPLPATKCHKCSAVWDHNGNYVSGDEGCQNITDSRFLTDCAPDETFCDENVLVDGKNGEQVMSNEIVS